MDAGPETENSSLKSPRNRRYVIDISQILMRLYMSEIFLTKFGVKISPVLSCHVSIHIVLDTRKSVFGLGRPACASAQSDQCLCYLLIGNLSFISKLTTKEISIF